MTKPNIFFLVIDSLRQDKCHGKDKSSLTPNLNKIIKNGTFFEQAISTSPITVTSLSSIFTGLYPYESTTLDNDLFNLNSNTPNLIQKLIEHQYNVSAVIPEALSHTNIAKIFPNIEFFNSFATLYDGVGEQIIQKLQNNLKTPWFLYVHLEDLHGNAMFNFSNDISINNFQGNNQYEKMLSALDIWLGKILDNVDSNNTLLIITSDHGSTFADFTNEMLNFNLENDKLKKTDSDIGYKLGHKIFTSLPKNFIPIRKKIADKYRTNKKKKIQNKLETRLNDIDKLEPTPYQERLLKKSVVYPSDCYDENFRPALIFSGPQIPKNKIVKKQVSTIDIFPTIFDIIDIQQNNSLRGRSLFTLFSDQAFEEKSIMLDSASDTTRSKYSDTIGLRTSKFKYFRDRQNSKKNVHLFDLEKDPLELDNVYENYPDLIKNFENEFEKIDPNTNFTFKRTNQLSKNDTEKAKDILRDLGYIQ